MTSIKFALSVISSTSWLCLVGALNSGGGNWRLSQKKARAQLSIIGIMRRSRAPSKIFRTPLLDKSSTKGTPLAPVVRTVDSSGRESETVPLSAKDSDKGDLENVPPVQLPTHANQIAKRKRYTPPQPNARLSERPSVLHTSARRTQPDDEATTSPAASITYYNCIWCKFSRKKHKVWEGDAIVSYDGKTVILKDMEGKDLGKTRCKSSDFPSIGGTLLFSGKEIELAGEISASDYESGKCFVSAHIPTSCALTSKATVPMTAFKVINKNGASISSGSAAQSRKRKTSLYDPTAPGSIILPKPGEVHREWGQAPDIVDVVIDPFIGCSLRAHQIEGVRFLYECVMGLRDFAGNGAILADEMGVGKTLQCITLVWTLLKQGPLGTPVAKRILIVTPGSLVKNWKAEFQKWLGNERLRVYAVSGEQKAEDFSSSRVYPVMIISYEMLLRKIDSIKGTRFDLIICDEAHRLKNSKVKTNTLMSSLQCQRRICLTGTPIQNDLKEFHSIVEFCNAGVIGNSKVFSRVYEEPILRARQPGASEPEKELGSSRAEELSRLISLFYLRRTNDVNKKYLPPKHEYVVFVQATKTQRMMYKQVLDSRFIQGCLFGTSGSDRSASYLVALGMLKKCANSPSLLRDIPSQSGCEIDFSTSTDDDDSQEHGGKLNVLMNLLSLIHSSGLERVVVVSNSTKCLDLIGTMCKSAQYNCARLDGTTPTDKRMEIVNNFNSNLHDQFVFLLSSKAGGVGLNIVGASRLVLYDIDWNPANDLQAMARVWRDGQTKPVHIYRLLAAGTIEEKIYQRQISKQGLESAITATQNGGAGTTEFSKDELKNLFQFHETPCQTFDILRDTLLVDNGTKRSTHGDSKSHRGEQLHELMTWEHCASPVRQLPDGFLSGLCPQDVSFVFYKDTSKSDGVE